MLYWMARTKENDSGCGRREANYEETSAEVGWFWIKAYKLIICNTVEAFSFFFLNAYYLHTKCVRLCNTLPPLTSTEMLSSFLSFSYI